MTPGEEKNHTFLSCSNQLNQNLNEELAPGSSRTEVIKALSMTNCLTKSLFIQQLFVSISG